MFIVVPKEMLERIEIAKSLGDTNDEIFKDFILAVPEVKEEEKKEASENKDIFTTVKETVENIYDNITNIFTKEEVTKEKEIVVEEKKETSENKETEVKEEKKEETTTEEAMYPQEDEEIHEEEKTEEPNAELKKPETPEDAIFMGARKECPVKIVPTKSEKAKVNVTSTSKSSDKSKVDVTKKSKTEEVVLEKDKGIEEFKQFLEKEEIPYSNLKRVNTGLIELTLENNMVLSVDINDRLYGIGKPVFFIGKVQPLEEINRKGVILCKESVNAVIANKAPKAKLYVPDEISKVYTELDINTLKEADHKTKLKVIAKAHKAITELNDDIKKQAAGTPVRFAFAKYKSIDDFCLVSSSRNSISALCNEKLRTDKTIWIEVKDMNASLLPPK